MNTKPPVNFYEYKGEKHAARYFIETIRPDIKGDDIRQMATRFRLSVKQHKGDIDKAIQWLDNATAPVSRGVYMKRRRAPDLVAPETEGFDSMLGVKRLVGHMLGHGVSKEEIAIKLNRSCMFD